MSHIIVFVNILILTTGFVVVYQGIQTYRTFRFPAVRSFVLYIGLYNSVMLLTLIAQYLLRNVGSLQSDEMYILIVVGMGLVGFTLAAMEISAYASALWHLSGGSRVPAWFVYSYGFVCSSWLAFFIVGSYRFFRFADKGYLIDVHANINYSLIAIFLLLPLLLLLRTRAIPQERPKLMIRTAGLVLFAFACLDALVMVLASPWNIFASMLSTLALNLLLLVKFIPFVAAIYGPVVEATASHLSLETICSQYHFSTRERDIIQMILKGKSNKEIEQELFISPHTVKNHIYHIFQKAGINSRGQLMSMILQSSSEPAGRNES